MTEHDPSAEPAQDDTPSDAEAEAQEPHNEQLEELLDTSRYRLSDGQALALLGAYLVFRTVTTNVGLAFLPALVANAPWAAPLLRNDWLTLVTVGTAVRGSILILAAVAAASFVQSMITGLVHYWAGWRFGPELAKKAEEGGGAWSSIWNPEQVAKAHSWLERYGTAAVFLARAAVWWMLTPVLLVAGSSRMTFSKFVAAYTAGSVAFAGLMLWLGGRAGDQWPWLPGRIEAFAGWSFRIGLVLLVVLIIAVIASPKSKRGAQQDKGS